MSLTKITAFGNLNFLSSQLFSLIYSSFDHKKELEKNKFDFKGTGPFTVNLKAHTAQKVIQKISTELTTLDIHVPSLEDAYVEIIKKNHAKS